MKITGQAVSVTELIKDTSEKFGNGGLRRFISEIKNSQEQLFGDTFERAELLGTRNFVVLKNMFASDIGDITPFKNISDEIKVYRESQSAFCRFFKGRVLDKIQKQCTKIIEINKECSRSPVSLHDATLPDSAVYTTKEIMGKHKDLGLFVLEKSLRAVKYGAPVNLADPDKRTQVTIQTSGTVELPVPQPVV
ncbi:hypothetical protein AAZR23_18955 [Morganella sp. Je.2.23]|uniref:hypothetical protein n=1 Tax=Morganella sp. Je.2.23 TaxID=3142840 RepID=UPI003DA9CF8B